jgi:hypothetical protein
MVDRPMPRVTDISRPFWDGCNEGRLMLQHCLSCRRAIYFPRVCCPHCQHGDLAWREASGEGQILTFTVVHRPEHPSFLPDAPYVFAAITLAEGPLFYSRLIDPPARDNTLLRRRVVAEFVDHAPTQKLPYFRVADAG